MGHNNKKRITKTIPTGLVASLGFATIIPALAVATGLATTTFATGANGQVRLNTEVATAIAMKIASPNDTNPDCMIQSGITYGEANRYATSNGAEGSKQVDTFDGTVGGADELNSNTSCATLTMNPNTYDSTYSDVTVYTNSPNGFAVSLQAAEPNLVNTEDSTQYIPAGTLTESGNTVLGGQNKWAYKTDNGIITSWTPVSATAATIKSYDQETSNGSTTRVTYGVSTGNNPTGTYVTTLTYTATMFDSFNPFVSKLTVSTNQGISASESSLSIPFGKSTTITVTPETGYYLSEVTCSNGIECSGYETGQGQTSTQTITITNKNTHNAGTITITAASPYSVCSASTSVGETCRNTSSDSTLMLRLADGNFWTKESQGTTTWDDLSSVSCPANTSKPTAAAFQTLVRAYGGTSDSYYGSPYGTRDDDPDLYNILGKWGYFWSVTEYNSAHAWALEIDVGYSSVFNSAKSSSRRVLCYRAAMQNFSASTASGDANGTEYSFMDTRDSKIYSAAKLADGKIWMTKNLGLVGPKTLTSGDSNVSTSFSLTASDNSEWCIGNSADCDNKSMVLDPGIVAYGSYYNWYAATAGTGTYEKSSGVAPSSICPKNWRLPTNSEFQTLYDNYGSASNMMNISGPAFALSGLRVGDASSGQNHGGYYWSSVAKDNSRVYSLRLYDNSDIHPQYDNEYKWRGLAVRCVAN